jgi:hypothetical protein
MEWQLVLYLVVKAIVLVGVLQILYVFGWRF